MGHRIYQRILKCGDCERIPDDGEPMWEMCGKYICETCIDKDDDEPGRQCKYCGEESCDCDML